MAALSGVFSFSVSSSFVVLGILTATTFSSSLHLAQAQLMDSRDINNGTIMFSYGYLDQPYCVVNNATQEWTCIITADVDGEGGPGEHMVSIVSTDHGATWSEPVTLEPNQTVANSYGVIVISPAGRIFALYNMNLDNVTTYPNGQPLERTDELGHFVMKYSDDGGRSWSDQRYEVPYRLTSIDLNNTFQGKTKLMWSVDQVKVDTDLTVYYAFTKIGVYPENPPEEVWFLSSPNLLTVTDPEDVVWNLLPEGDVGIAPPGGNPNIMEEGHFMKLLSGGCYAIGRTSQGLLAATRTSDSTAATGWINTTWALYWNNTVSSVSLEASAQPLANPRGPITMKRFSNNQYLLLFYNNHETSFLSRNPYWLSSGKESGGQILWSQPEIIIYDRTNLTDRPGYPDFIEDTATGLIHITETQKLVARIHTIDPRLLGLLWRQDVLNETATLNLTVAFNASSQGHAYPTPPLPSFSSYYEYLQGFSIDLWLENHGNAKEGEILLESRNPEGQGFALVVGSGQSVVLEMSDGKYNFSGGIDIRCTASLLLPGKHFFGVVVDGGARIVSFLVDGFVCDGAQLNVYGWFWFEPFASLNFNSTMILGPNYTGVILGGHVYNRMLQTSELVGNYRSSLAY